MPSVTLDGTTLHYLDEGSGDPALVLVHAFPLHAGMWEAQVADLSDRCRVVAPDLPGFGGTAGPEDPAAYSMDGYADLVAALVEHLDLGPVVLGGLSMGGYVSFAFLRRHRHLLAGLVLADTKAEADTAQARDRRTNQQRQVSEGRMDEVVEALLQGLLWESTAQNRPDVVERVRALMQNSPAGYVGALDAMKRRPDSTDLLDTIDVPTLFLVGEHDTVSSPDVVRSMHDRVMGSTMAVLPWAAHLSNLEATPEFNQALGRFLDDL